MTVSRMRDRVLVDLLGLRMLRPSLEYSRAHERYHRAPVYSTRRPRPTHPTRPPNAERAAASPLGARGPRARAPAAEPEGLWPQEADRENCDRTLYLTP